MGYGRAELYFWEELAGSDSVTGLKCPGNGRCGLLKKPAGSRSVTCFIAQCHVTSGADDNITTEFKSHKKVLFGRPPVNKKGDKNMLLVHGVCSRYKNSGQDPMFWHYA